MTTNQGIKYKLSSLLAGMHVRKIQENDAITFADELENTHSILVMMPREVHQFEQANYTLLPLVEAAAPLKVHAYVNEIYKTWLDRSLIRDALIFTEKDFGRMTLLPKNDLVNQVAALECNLVIDMNMDYNLVAAYIAAVTQARIRIAMERGENRFFNVMVQIAAEDPKEKYQKYMDQIIRSFLTTR